MFAIEEDLDKKLWLYAIHLGKDRSEVVNDLLRPIVASMVLYDSRDRRGGRNAEPAPDRRRDRRRVTQLTQPVAIIRSDCARESSPRVSDRRPAMPTSGLFRRLDVGEEQALTGSRPSVWLASGFRGGQAEGLEHVLPAAQAGVLGLDGGQDGLALGLGQPLPGGTELGLAGLVALGLTSSLACRCCDCAIAADQPLAVRFRGRLGSAASGPDNRRGPGNRTGSRPPGSRPGSCRPACPRCATASRRPRSWCGSGRAGASRPAPGPSWR